MSACTISSAKPMCGSAFTYGNVVVIYSDFAIESALLRQVSPFDIVHEFLQCRGDRNRENDAEEARELRSDNEREDNEERRYDDDACHDERIDEVVLKL